MFLNCPQCETRLQIDKAKIPSEPFKIRCPKCQASVDVPSSTSESSATEATSSVTPNSGFQAPASAPLFNSKPEHQPPTQMSAKASAGIDDLARVLDEVLRNGPSGGASRPPGTKRPIWDRRKALICCSPAHRQTIASLLADNDYEVYVADDTAQALGRMRDNQMDVILLDSEFDPTEQGATFVTREIQLMRPAERRRLFVVYLNSSLRTMDLHAAFLHNVNLVLNPSDVKKVADVLDVSLRHYNELYRDFNGALEVAPI
jgi:predicted Zn finger-like uncharacterized protein